MKLSEVLTVLKHKQPSLDVEYLIINKSTHEIVSMSLSDETVDMVKLFKSFRPVKGPSK